MENNINGQKLSQIPRKEFSDRLIEYCDNNKRIRGPANKCWDIEREKIREQGMEMWSIIITHL